MKFPVSAVSYEDAIAYAAWLDRTRRVVGARLCDDHEWERAARGGDGRVFPTGATLVDANIDVTYGREPLAFAHGEQAWDRWNGRLYTRIEEPEGNANLAYDLYGTFSTSYRESKAGKKTPVEGSEKAKALALINTAFQTDLTVMFMPFLMQEPGTKLDYAGAVKDGEVEYHDIKISFASGDTTHADLVYHAIVDKTTYVIRRVDVTRPTTSERLGFELSDWTEAGGLKLPGTRKNLGSGELAQSKDIKVGSPDDTLYMAPLY
jgi:hypothetical protein